MSRIIRPGGQYVQNNLIKLSAITVSCDLNGDFQAPSISALHCIRTGPQPVYPNMDTLTLESGHCACASAGDDK